MKNWLNRCIVVLVAALTASCGTGFEDIAHTVKKVEDGNTILLKNGIRVHLIGVEPTQASQEFLEDKALNRKVRIVFDRSNYPDTDQA